MDEQIDDVLNDKLLNYLLFPLIIWLLAGIEWFLQIRNAPRIPGTFAVVAAILTVYGAIRIGQLRRQINLLKQGRDGERFVGQYLERLRLGGAQVFHDVPGDGFNLDHVVIAPQGIFVVETKTWSKRRPRARITVRAGTLFKDGYKVDPNPIEQAVAESAWLSRLLVESTGKSLSVRGVVLFPGWFVEPMDGATKNKAWVLEPKAFPAFLDHEPTRLAESDVTLAAFHLTRYVRTT
ncbi:MAG TPA: nuclease-related domain-containing protein [Steroidobacteraceae bacterium]